MTLIEKNVFQYFSSKFQRGAYNKGMYVSRRVYILHKNYHDTIVIRRSRSLGEYHFSKSNSQSHDGSALEIPYANHAAVLT